MVSHSAISLVLVSTLSVITLQVFGADVPCAPVATRECPGIPAHPNASLAAVFITDCFDEPCYFNRGQDVRMEMDIDFHGDVPTMKAELHALIGSIPIPWYGVNPEACENIISQGKCPAIRTDVRYQLKDGNGATLICWIVKAQVR